MPDVAIVYATLSSAFDGLVYGYWDRGRPPLSAEEGEWGSVAEAAAWGSARAPSVLVRCGTDHEERRDPNTHPADRLDGYGGTVFVAPSRSTRLAFLVQVRALRAEPVTDEPTGHVISVWGQKMWPKFWTLREATSYACDNGDLAMVSVSQQYYVVKGAVEDAALVPCSPPVVAAPWPAQTLAVTHRVPRVLLTGRLTASRALLGVREADTAIEVDVAIDPSTDIDEAIERAGDLVFDAVPRSICVPSFAREHVIPLVLFSP